MKSLCDWGIICSPLSLPDWGRCSLPCPSPRAELGHRWQTRLKSLKSEGERMDSIVGLLRGLCPEVERQLKSELTAVKGMIARAFLPQFWVFQTEVETATFMVDSHGNAFAQAGGVPQADVTIRWSHDLLESVLRTRSRTSVPDGAHPTVQTHTPKGEAAFSFLRGRLGL